MAVPNYYDVLGLSSSSTQDEIRTAYLFLTRQIRTGERPASLKPLLEQAYANLGHPDRRLQYDFELTVPSEYSEPRLSPPAPSANVASSRLARPAPYPRPLDIRLGLMAAVVASLIGVCGMALIGHRGLKHASPMPAQEVVSRAGTPGADSPPQTAVSAARPQLPVETLDSAPQPEETPQDSADLSYPPQAASQSVRPPPPASQSAPVRSQQVAYTRREQSTVAAPDEVIDAPAHEQVQVDDIAAGLPEADASPPATSSGEFSNPSPGEPALVWSQVFTGPRATFRLPGRYCVDASGGEVFVPMNAPVSSGLTC